MNTPRSHAASRFSCYPLFQRTALASAVFLACTSLAHGETETTDTQSLSTLTVTSERLSNPVGAGEGYIAESSRTATKTDTPWIETPRSVSTVTRAQLDDRDPVSVGDALNYTSGVQGNVYGADNKQDWFTIRGFPLEGNGIFRDGLRSTVNDYFTQKIDPFALERIEVLKGPSSVLYGQSSPGGIVNMTTKRPTYEPQGEVGISYGSFGRKEATVDVSGPLAETGALYRIVALQRSSSENQLDHADSERTMLAPSLTLFPSEKDTLTLIGYYQHDDSDPFSQFYPAEGTLHASSAGQGYIDSDNATGDLDDQKYKREYWALGYEYDHRFDDAWSFEQNLRYSHLDLDMNQQYFSSYADDLYNGLDPSVRSQYSDLSDPSRRKVLNALIYRDGDADIFSIDNHIKNHWVNDFVDNTVLVGLDYQYYKNDYDKQSGFPLIRQVTDIYSGSTASGYSWFNPYGGSDGSTPVEVSQDNLDHVHSRLTQLGIYIQDQAKLYDRILVSAGARYDDARADIITNGESKKNNAYQATYSASAAYLFDSGVTPYISYSEFFLPVADVDLQGNAIDPETGDQTELGIKYQPNGFDAQFQLAAFEINRDNVRTQAGTSQETTGGKWRVHGIEASTQANLTDELSVTASYTWLDPEIRRGESEAEVGKRPATVAKRFGSAWANYDFKSGLLNGFGVGAGVRYVGDSYGDDINSSDFHVSSYTLYDAAVRYRLDDHWRFQVSAQNLTDKEYVSSCDYWCYYGTRRNIIGTVNYQF